VPYRDQVPQPLDVNPLSPAAICTMAALLALAT
jgi:hypothetical protein